MGRKPHRARETGRRAGTPSRPGWRTPLAFAALAAALLAVYGPALRGQFLWDDDFHVPAPSMRSLHGLARIWIEPGSMQQYYPLVDSAFWAMHALWGGWTTGYHLVTLAMHFAAAVLLYAVLMRLAIPGALLAAAIFALHPLHVESVAWITELKNTMSAVFYLASLWVYLRFDAERRGGLLAASLALFALALLSKTSTVTLPGAVLVILWWQRGALSWRRDVWPLLPFFALAALSGAMTAWMEWNHVGASGEAFRLGAVQRLLLASRIPWFYLGELLWPANLVFIHPKWEIDPGQAWQWAFPAATAAALAAAWAVRRRSRTPLAVLLFFGGSLVPVLGLVNVFFFRYSYVSDHFPYLASFGVIAAASAAIATGLARAGLWGRPAGHAVCAALLAALALLGARETPAYASSEALFETTTQRNPGAWMAHYNLGLIAMQLGRDEEAARHFQSAIDAKPDSLDAYNNLAITFVRRGRASEAVPILEKVLAMDPDYPLAHGTLGLALEQQGRPREAIEHYATAVRLRPDFPEAQNQWGQALLSLRDPAGAAEHFEAAVRMRPDFLAARVNLATALTALGRPWEAIRQYEEVARLAPGDVNARLNLGMALAVQGRVPEAVAEFEQAVRLSPGNPQALQALQWARSLPQ